MRDPWRSILRTNSFRIEGTSARPERWCRRGRAERKTGGSYVARADAFIASECALMTAGSTCSSVLRNSVSTTSMCLDFLGSTQLRCHCVFLDDKDPTGCQRDGHITGDAQHLQSPEPTSICFYEWCPSYSFLWLRSRAAVAASYPTWTRLWPSRWKDSLACAISWGQNPSLSPRRAREP